MNHVIKTQVLHIQTNVEEWAFSLQQEMSTLFYSTILPELEKTFNDIAPADRMIHLDCVEIDLGFIHLKEIQKAGWQQIFKQKFTRQFQDAVISQRMKTKELPLEYSIARQWLYYMEHGFLPWNTLQTNNEWYNKALEGLASDYRSIDLLRVLITNNINATKRIVLLHSAIYLSHLVEVLTAEKQSGLVALIETIRQILFGQDGIETENVQSKKFKQQTWEQVFRFIASVKGPVTEIEIIKKIIDSQIYPGQLKKLSRMINYYPVLTPLIPCIKEQIQNTSALKSEEQVIKNDSSEKEITTSDIISVELKKQDDIKLPTEGLFIHHAGIVLLHPFINHLFTNLRLVENGKFVNNIEQQKGLLLLHYMCSGRVDFEEHELVINKILCGYPVNEPVENTITLSNDETTECDELLKSVISQWSILKNTSPEGLRGNFLERSGKLFTKNNQTYVMVEAAAIDVLLDHLPWGLSMIKLPWMREVLKVEWR